MNFHVGDGRRSGKVTASCDNVIAWRIGEACQKAAAASAGDYIDRGLALLHELEAKGFDIVVPGADGGITGDGRGEAATIAGLESATGHLSALVDDLRSLMARAMANMKALHDAAKPADESRGDFDAKVPYDAFVRFVDAHAALLSDLHNSPHELPSTTPQQQQAASVLDGFVLVPVAATKEMISAVCDCHDIDHREEIAANYAAMLSAAPKACQTPDGWQPIETAPKDGVFYLAFDEEYGFFVENCPTGHYAGEWNWNESRKQWRGHAHSDDRDATHWMPLPAAPKVQETGA